MTHRVLPLGWSGQRLVSSARQSGADPAVLNVPALVEPDDAPPLLPVSRKTCDSVCRSRLIAGADLSRA
jgi:hypothetical protein